MIEWTSFTRIPLKAQSYERETYFREGLADAEEVLGDGAPVALRKAALLLVKPDGLAGGKVSTVLGFLRANDFVVTAVELPTITRFHWRELWRYQLTSATLDRLAVNDLVLRGGALLLLLRREGDSDMPASVRLSRMKGPSDIASQRPDCLRRLLAQPNRVISFIHVADEPADVLRELAIILDAPARRRVLSALGRGVISRPDQEALDGAVTASDSSARAFDEQAALRRVEDALRQASGTAAPSAAQLASYLEQMRRGERIQWRPFEQRLEATGVSLDRWDVATLGAAFIVYDEPGTSKLIKAVDAKLWSLAASP